MNARERYGERRPRSFIASRVCACVAGDAKAVGRSALDWELSRRQDAGAGGQPSRSPLVRRPYDLRHACLSTWLNGGVYPTQVAQWAGHSVDVLPRIYAKCIAGQNELAKRRIDEALRQD
jgi:integrase